MNNASDKGEKRIESIADGPLTSRSLYTVKAKIFIDCSGDSILAR